MASPAATPSPDPPAPSVTPFTSAPTFDMTMYGPFPASSIALTMDPSLPDDILRLHTHEYAKPLEIDARLTRLTVNVSDVDARKTDLTGRIDILTTQRAALSHELDPLRTSHYRSSSPNFLGSSPPPPIAFA